MRKIALTGAMVLVLFVLSAAGSWLMRRGQAAHGEGGEGHDTPAEPTGKAAAPHGGAPLRPAVRPPYAPEADGAVQLANNLRTQMETVRAREQQLTLRQKNLEIIYKDLRNERGAIDGLRKQIDDEMKMLRDKMGGLEHKLGEMDRQREKIGEQIKEMKRNVTQMEGVEKERMKQLAAMYDSMEPEAAAKHLQQMADSGKMDTAVKILATMRERQAARVLAQFSDHTTVVQLLDRLKGLQRPGSGPERVPAKAP